MKMTVNQDFKSLFACVAESFGEETARHVKDAIAEALSIEKTDVADLTAKIDVLKTLLSPNDKGQADAAANLLAALTDLNTRVGTLEGSTAINELTIIVTQLGDSIQAEVDRAKLAEAALAEKLNEINISLVEITQLVETAATNPSGNCDCSAIDAKLLAHSSALSNLSASDAAQAKQIADLQELVATLGGVNSAVEDRIAAVKATADAAKAMADAAKATADAAQSAVNEAIREHARDHADHEQKFDRKVDREEIAVACDDMANAFRTGLVKGKSR
jgi:chromosome segregation ATPase